jgi:protease-4
LAVDSPGGTVQACFQAEQAFRDLREKKPVVVSMGEQATSGAYLISSAANYIYAYDYTATGGLGVIAVWVSYENYLEKEGIKYYVWKTGEMKDLGAEYRGPTEEENRYLQELVENYMSELLSRIRANRPRIQGVEELEEGTVYYGKDALNYGLVDGLGDLEDAERKAASLAGLKEYKLVTLG